MDGYKNCSSCYQFLPIRTFSKRKSSKDGLQSECKSCCSKYAKKYYVDNKDELLENSRTYYKENKDEIKENSQTYYQDNKSSVLEKAKHYKKEHKDEIAMANKTYAKNNKGKITDYQNQYYQTNKKELRKNRSEYEIRRSKQDPPFLLRKAVSAHIRIYLRSKNARKNNESILDYLPYTMQEFREHLERQFEPWMTWDNYGIYDKSIWIDGDVSTWKWQLDHIVPHSMFRYNSMKDESFQKCWSLSNLRPLSAKQNVMDGVNRSRHVNKV